MSIDNIIFDETDSKKDKAIKTLLLRYDSTIITE